MTNEVTFDVADGSLGLNAGRTLFLTRGGCFVFSLFGGLRLVLKLRALLLGDLKGVSSLLGNPLRFMTGQRGQWFWRDRIPAHLRLFETGAEISKVFLGFYDFLVEAVDVLSFGRTISVVRATEHIAPRTFS